MELNTQPSGDVVVTVSVPDNSGVSVDKSTLTFNTTNWNAAQTVTVTADDDNVDEDWSDVTVSHAVDAGNSADEYDGVSIEGMTVHRQRHRGGDPRTVLVLGG